MRRIPAASAWPHVASAPRDSAGRLVGALHPTVIRLWIQNELAAPSSTVVLVRGADGAPLLPHGPSAAAAAGVVFLLLPPPLPPLLLPPP